jgi:protein-tyrosine-phosphatase/DNA-binding transcriptional ArsR family regulator
MYHVVMGSLDQVTPAFLRLVAHPLRWRLLGELARSDLRVRELATLTGEQQNLISYHLRLLRDGGLLSATRSTFDGRDSYYHLDLDRCAQLLAGVGAALHPGLGPPAPGPRRSPRVSVLFVCTGNSARSPVAEALLRHRAGAHVATVSAGTRPKPSLHPDAVRVLHEEFGIDITGQAPRHLDTVSGRRFHYVISLCDKAREACPDFPDQPRRMHWSMSDPATDRAGYPAFQRIAAAVDTRIRHLLPVLADSGA